MAVPSSYANYDDHPHLHKQEELLHITFVNNNFYENPVYKESLKMIVYSLKGRFARNQKNNLNSSE